MKSQVTRVTAATLLSVNQGDSVLANLAACDVHAFDKYRSTLADDQLRGMLLHLHNAEPMPEKLSDSND